MNIHLNSILPDDISDETAYHMGRVFSELREKQQSNLTDYLLQDFGGGDPF